MALSGHFRSQIRCSSTDTLSIFFCAERGGYRNNRVILWKILIMRRVEKFFPGEVILPKQPLECIDFQGFIDSVSVNFPLNFNGALTVCLSNTTGASILCEYNGIEDVSLFMPTICFQRKYSVWIRYRRKIFRKWDSPQPYYDRERMPLP